jgi:hypothetical protein
MYWYLLCEKNSKFSFLKYEKSNSNYYVEVAFLLEKDKISALQVLRYLLFRF